MEELKEEFNRVVSVWTGHLVDNLSISCGYVTQKEFLVIDYHRKIGENFHHVQMELLKANEYSKEEQTIFLYVKQVD